jgi:hypothetical protein
LALGDVVLLAALFACYGAVGGSVVGLLCALALPAMERSGPRSRRDHGRFAASVTALLVAPFAIFLGLLATMEVDNLLALAVEISVPTIVSIGVAHLVGQRIWQRRWAPSACCREERGWSRVTRVR